MNTKLASSLIAAAFLSACASAPLVSDGGFPPPVVYGQPAFAQHATDVPPAPAPSFARVGVDGK